MKGRTCEESTVRMKCGARDRSRAIMVKEARVRFEIRKMSSIDVEGFDLMSVGAASLDISLKL